VAAALIGLRQHLLHYNCMPLLGIEVDKTLQVGHSLHLATAQILLKKHCAVWVHCVL
jgi:hypothetical protein